VNNVKKLKNDFNLTKLRGVMFKEHNNIVKKLFFSLLEEEVV